MKRQPLLLLATSVLLLSSCNAPSTETKAKTTIMIYMCGSNLESSRESGSSKVAGLATGDLKEILSVEGQPKDVNIIVETGGARQWSTSLGIKANELGRYHVENQKLVKDDSVLKASMGKASTLQSFIEWGLTEYPAEKTGLILWNHGGALDGVCFDELYGDDSLTDVEVCQALEGAFQTVGRTEKLEWIGYDACLMAVQDIAEMNSKYFNYMVSSQESEVGDGWAYDRWIGNVYNHESTESYLKAACDGFIASVDSLVSYYMRHGYFLENDQGLSVVDLNKIGDYKTALEDLAAKMKPKLNKVKPALIETMKTVKSYANMVVEDWEYNYYVNYYGYPQECFSNNGDGTYTLLGYYSYGTFDALDMLNKMEASGEFGDYLTEIQTAKNALQEAIIHNNRGSAAGESNGLCAVVSMNNEYFSYDSEYTNFNNWRELFN